MQREEYTAANRLAWNEAAPIHARQKFEQLLADFKQPGFSCLDEIETEILQRIGLDGRRVAQLCCNNGRELLSVKNLGAASCTGFDISDDFIEQARQLMGASGIECEFVQTDVYNIPNSYDGKFDLINLTVGALGWLPDLPAFFQVLKRLLVPGGQLFIYEMHPMLDMFEGYDQNDPPQLYHSYFRQEPYRDDNGLDYYSGQNYQSSAMYWFHHKMSDIIGGLLDSGFQLEAFREYDHDVSGVFAHFAKLKIKPPLSYTLLARLQNI